MNARISEIMRFCLWAQRMHQPLNAVAVQRYFACGRAAAYRWIRAWKDANGQA